MRKELRVLNSATGKSCPCFGTWGPCINHGAVLQTVAAINFTVGQSLSSWGNNVFLCRNPVTWHKQTESPYMVCASRNLFRFLLSKSKVAGCLVTTFICLFLTRVVSLKCSMFIKLSVSVRNPASYVTACSEQEWTLPRSHPSSSCVLFSLFSCDHIFQMHSSPSPPRLRCQPNPLSLPRDLSPGVNWPKHEANPLIFVQYRGMSENSPYVFMAKGLITGSPV
jgi:hypothetical protein